MSTSAVLDELERLTAAYGKPFGTAAKQQAEVYADAFRRIGLPMVAVKAAVSEAIDLGKRFPSAAELIERARGHVPETDGERNQVYTLDACPHCRVKYFYAGYDLTPIIERGHGRDSRPGGVLPKMRCGCPQADPEWWTDAALNWNEDDERHTSRVKPQDYATNWKYRQGTVVQYKQRGGEPTRVW